MEIRAHLRAGQVIPAHPLALDTGRRFDERHQRALTRYYIAAGAGGIAVGVHGTQFAIRDSRHGLLRPVLELAAETATAELARAPRAFVRIAGVVGRTVQALQEARLARDLGYHAALLSLGAWRDVPERELLEHCRVVGEVLPLVGFYLQPAVGGRLLSYDFWRRFAELPSVIAIKIAPFNRYQTLDVVRAVGDAGRPDIALYTGNDDNIVVDLLTRFPCFGAEHPVAPRIVGGLLGQWAVWTRRAVAMLDEIKAVRDEPTLSAHWLARAAQLTDANGALFDARHNFAGAIAGIQEILHRQGLVASPLCLGDDDVLSPGQRDEIDRVLKMYPDLTDDAFVKEHVEEWTM